MFSLWFNIGLVCLLKMFLGRWVEQLNWIVWFQGHHVFNKKIMQGIQSIVFLNHLLFIMNIIVHMNSSWLFIAYLNGCCKLEDVGSHCKRPFLICVWLFPSLSMMLDLIIFFLLALLLCQFCLKNPLPHLTHITPPLFFHLTVYVSFCLSNSNTTFVAA